MFFSMKDKIVIPKDAIRIRVIANSNEEYDQNIKNEVKDIVEDELYYLLKDTVDIHKARNLINNDLTNLDSKVDDFLKSKDYKLGYDINFGYNYFPEKEYKGIKYDEGYYESLVITLGEGNGKNYWCVLYPPLCLLEDETSNNEYRSYVLDLIKKYLT